MYDIGISIYSTLCILRISTATKINSKKVLRLALLMKQQGYNWQPKTGWASSNAAYSHCLAAPSNLPKSGWTIAHPDHPQLTPLKHNLRFVLG